MSLACRGHHGIGAFVPGVPRFVQSLAQNGRLWDGALQLTAEAQRYLTYEDAETLVSYLRDPSRSLPAIVISEPANGQPTLIDADRLARTVTGLASVHVASFNAAFNLTDVLGKEWSVFHGACRTYMPGFNPAIQTLYDHPLILATRLQFEEGRIACFERLCRASARFSIERPDDAAQRISFADIRRRLHQIDLNTQSGLAREPADKISVLEAKLDAAKADIKDYIAIADEDAARAREAIETRDEAIADNQRLRYHIRALEQRHADHVAPLELAPSSYAAMPDWIDRRFAGRLVLPPKARRALAASQYSDPKQVADCLEMLANNYVDMRRGTDRSAFEERCHNLHVEDTAIAANPGRLKNDPQFWCRFEGRDLFMERHIKRGNSRHSREALRIYYAWDEESQCVVVGHLTTHLSTEIS